jgi:hypothetical protein
MGVVRRFPLVTFALIRLCQAAAADTTAIVEYAGKFVPGFTWQRRSVLIGNFDCSGRRQQAILGTNKTTIAILIFLDGTKSKPEILRYSGKARNPTSAILTRESLDFDPKLETGSDLPGFRRSKTCTGLNLSDGGTDSAHIYWNIKLHEFSDWSR